MKMERLPLGPMADDVCGDDRAELRIVTVCRHARATTMADEGLCRVVNISNGGMKIATGLALELDETIWVTLAERITLSGKVIWINGKEAGLQFDENIDCALLLRRLAEEQKSGKSRPLRLSIDALGLSFSELGVDVVRVLDISRNGMKLAHRQHGVEAGLAVKIRLANGLERRGVVRWSEAGVAGVQLLEPVDQADLESARRLTGKD